MDPQLVGAPGPRLDSSHAIATRQTPRPITRHSVSAGWPPGSTFIHQPRLSSRRRGVVALVSLRRAGDGRPIGLGDLALLEQEPQSFQRFMMSPEDEAARRVTVEPVSERGISRQTEPQGVEIVLKARPPFGPLWTATPAGLSRTSIDPSRYKSRALVSSGVMRT